MGHHMCRRAPSIIARTAALLTAALSACCSTPAREPSPPSPPERIAVDITTPEGLVLRDTALGTGELVRAGDTITMNFTAKLADGTVYDSSDERRRPLTITLSNPNLIRGLREGIPGMRVGGTRELRIPWRLAYGEQGRSPIPPKTDLKFEITVISVRSP